MSSGVRRIAVTLLLMAHLPTAIAATTAQIDTARKYGLWWLITHQNGDGRWKAASGLEVQSTAAALDAMANAGIKKGYSYGAAVAWLENANAPSVDSLSRKIMALSHASANTSSLTTNILTQKNDFARGSWGAYPKYQPTFPDSALATDVFLVSGATYSDLNYSLGFIGGRQNGDGGWAYSASAPTAATSSLIPTAYSVLTFAHAKAKGWGVDTNLTNGVNWLVPKAKSDGGFAEDTLATTGSPLETGLVCLALTQAKAAGNAAATATAAQTAIDNALTYLINNQGADGSWSGGDPFSTALALQALPATVMADTNNDGIPDLVAALMVNPSARSLVTGNGQSVIGVTVPTVLASTAYLNQSFSFPLTAPTGTAPYAWGITTGGLPTGLSLSSTTGSAISISGTPTAVGSYSFAYTVTDATGASAATIAQIDVLRAPPAPADGDLNGDGVVDVADVALAERIALGLIVPTPTQMAHGDVAPAGAPDGVIDAADVARIRRKALGLETF
jgi:hypothetical protein